MIDYAKAVGIVVAFGVFVAAMAWWYRRSMARIDAEYAARAAVIKERHRKNMEAIEERHRARREEILRDHAKATEETRENRRVVERAEPRSPYGPKPSSAPLWADLLANLAVMAVRVHYKLPLDGQSWVTSATPMYSMAEDLTTLGLSNFPSAIGLRAAWRKIARKEHPDAGGSTARFVAAQTAYDRLRTHMEAK